mmetsp:Transcript_87207/g.247622  ORF Transcript_87207/g.247622 Transcript_87207/m.247622 type:complete len:203 (-) Transcript_87207:180-788(-)
MPIIFASGHICLGLRCMPVDWRIVSTNTSNPSIAPSCIINSAKSNTPAPWTRWPAMSRAAEAASRVSLGVVRFTPGSRLPLAALTMDCKGGISIIHWIRSSFVVHFNLWVGHAAFWHSREQKTTVRHCEHTLSFTAVASEARTPQAQHASRLNSKMSNAGFSAVVSPIALVKIGTKAAPASCSSFGDLALGWRAGSGSHLAA